MGEIRAHLVIEILGRPKEHLAEALTTLVTRLGAEKGVKIVNKELHEPIPAQDSKDLFTTFAEIEVEFDSVENYFGIIFGYMPAHIEIVKPEKISLQNTHLNELGNNLLQRLHNYDAITKKSIVEREFILNELKKEAPEAFKRLTTKEEQKPKKKKKSR